MKERIWTGSREQSITALIGGFIRIHEEGVKSEQEAISILVELLGDNQPLTLAEVNKARRIYDTHNDNR